MKLMREEYTLPSLTYPRMNRSGSNNAWRRTQQETQYPMRYRNHKANKIINQEDLPIPKEKDKIKESRAPRRSSRPQVDLTSTNTT